MAGDRIRNLGRRSFILELQPYRNRTDFVVRRRTRRAGERSDTVLQIGTLNYSVDLDQPRDLIRDLRRIADVLERRYKSTSREAAPEPPGGGYGGQLPLPGFQPPDWLFSGSETGLDTTPATR
jgi:hypothetical protein